jgi:hypothetical protein
MHFHVIHVLEENDLPPFSYSVGIQHSSRTPELLVVGLIRELAHSIINRYNSRVRSGEVFKPGRACEGFIEGFGCEMRVVDTSHYKDYLGWCRWLYRGNDFKVFQLIYPNTDGVWPWEPDASEWFRARQPLLDRPA